ncbi:Chemotaxis protein methyltransferase CheR [Minicystis rosea]|nr:Chemotaxis protein methyltransferase CheR [Minicystis rosea]
MTMMMRRFDFSRSPSWSAARSKPIAYAAALASTGAMYLVRAGLGDVLKTRAPFIMFFFSITISARIGGLGPGLLATVLSTAIGWRAFLAPSRTSVSQVPSDAVVMALYIGIGVTISLVCERMHRAIEQAAEQAAARRVSEEQAERRLAEIQSIYGTAPVGLCTLDTDLRWIRINERLAQFNGAPVEAHIGRTCRELLPDLADVIEPLLRRVLGTGKPMIDVEITGRTAARPDEDRTWSTSAYPLRDAGGTIIGINLVCSDITERKRAEQRLRAASEAAERNLAQLEAVLGSIREGLAIAGPDGELVTMNAAGLRMLDVSSLAEARNSDIPSERRTLDGAPVAPEEQPLARLLRGERVERVEHCLRLEPGGPERILSYNGAPVLDREGRRIAFVVTFQDVTAEKLAASEREALLESERAARAEAERANRMKDEFLAVISHELRTPLNAILGWAGLLRRPGRTADQIDKGLEVIERNTRVQVQLISELLDVSRIVTGKIHLDLQPVGLSSVVEAGVDVLRAAAGTKGVDLSAAIAPIEAPMRGDPARLQQIVTNLIANAIKFTPAGGRVEVTLSSRDGFTDLTVRDTGHGISAEFIPHVFDRFRQADASTTRQHGGLGLGLAIVKHLVELHGGTVRAESAGVGQGATFTVSLPCEETRISTTALVTEEPPSLRGVRVLVLDDEQDTRDLVMRLLEENEAEVQAATSAEEALSLLRAQVPDVIVSDIGMPGMDGYALMRRVRSEGSNARHVPAIALTAFARAEDRARALAAGYQAHLTKPIEPAELVATVASVRTMRVSLKKSSRSGRSAA